VKTTVLAVVLTIHAVLLQAAIIVPPEPTETNAPPGSIVVPPPRGTPSAEKPMGTSTNAPAVPDVPQLVVSLSDGSKLIGTTTLKELALRSEALGKLTVPLGRIASVKFSKDRESVTVTLHNGDRLQAGLADTTLALTTLFGPVTVPLDKVTEMQVRTVTGSAMAETLKRGLVLHYSLDQNDSDKVADQSGNGQDGKAQGATWSAADRVGGGYQFDGRRSRILIGHHPSLNFGEGARTIAAWIRSRAASREHQAIFTKGTNPGYSFRLSPAPDRAIEYFKSAGGQYSFFTASHAITDDAWHHLAVVDQGNGAVDFYQDGRFLETVTLTNYNSDTDMPAAIGARPDVLGQLFNGFIADVRLYNRALAAEEVQALSSLATPANHGAP